MAGLLSLSKHPAILLLTAGPFDFTQGSLNMPAGPVSEVEAPCHSLADCRTLRFHSGILGESLAS